VLVNFRCVTSMESCLLTLSIQLRRTFPLGRLDPGVAVDAEAESRRRRRRRELRTQFVTCGLDRMGFMYYAMVEKGRRQITEKNSVHSIFRYFRRGESVLRSREKSIHARKLTDRFIDTHTEQTPLEEEGTFLF